MAWVICSCSMHRTLMFTISENGNEKSAAMIHIEELWATRLRKNSALTEFLDVDVRVCENRRKCHEVRREIRTAVRLLHTRKNFFCMKEFMLNLRRREIQMSGRISCCNLKNKNYFMSTFWLIFLIRLLSIANLYNYSYMYFLLSIQNKHYAYSFMCILFYCQLHININHSFVTRY